MWNRELSPAQKAHQARLHAESVAKMAKMREQEAQAKLGQEVKDAEREKFLERVKASRAAFANGQPLPDNAKVVTLASHYNEKRAAEKLAAEQAEAARRAALTPLDIYKSTLPWQERKRVEKWEAVNGMEWPLELTQKSAESHTNPTL